MSGQGVVRFFDFLLRVLRGFKRNQGLLLSGAVAYYTLLSVIPMSILALIVLTHFIEEQLLIQTLSTYLDMVIPGYAATLTEQVRVFLVHRKAVGGIGFLVMLFFSSMAFSILGKAISAIFSQQPGIHRRNLLISAIIPYGYILLMGCGIVAVSFMTEAIETLKIRHMAVFGLNVNLEGSTVVVLHLMAILTEILMLTSFYLVMPLVRIRVRHALIGGITAAILWEITRRVLVWYYAAVSMVNVIYGSIATVVVALLSIEVVAIILLLGAQVIAELESRSGLSPKQERSGIEE
jgi:YihY family inner membrane protein